MGGMIAQLVTLEHPHVVATLSLLYTAARFDLSEAPSEVNEILGMPDATDRADAIRLFVEREQAAGTGGFDLADLGAREYDRCYCPGGARRQFAAISDSGDRTARLAQLSVPTTVIHGIDDALIACEEGVHLAQTIPGAELHLYAGMGHEMQRERWPDIIADITRNIARGECR
jgi:pimeloyl-ACP methyl ester carboxylesterase